MHNVFHVQAGRIFTICLSDWVSLDIPHSNTLALIPGIDSWLQRGAEGAVCVIHGKRMRCSPIMSEMFSLVSSISRKNNVSQTVRSCVISSEESSFCVFLPGNSERKYGAASRDVTHERASFQRLYLQWRVSEVQMHHEQKTLQRGRTTLWENQGVWWKKRGWKQHVLPSCFQRLVKRGILLK